MTGEQLQQYRDQLRAMADRVGATAAALEEQVRTPTGGQSAGNLSNAPMHLGDVGSEVYTQELNATLLENETHIQNEVGEALGRIEAGTYGTCENCRQPIPDERLDAIPYTRYCAPCAGKLQAGVAVNLNDGRPEGWGSTFSPPGSSPEPGGTVSHDDTEAEDTSGDEDDVHAAGTPGGGTAVGGLAGTTIGTGDPDDAGLEGAMGSGNFDVAIEGEHPEDVEAYAGHSGGAVGGTPANKRAVGGKARGGIAPQPGKGDSPTGQ